MVVKEFNFQPKKEIEDVIEQMNSMTISDQTKSVVEQVKLQIQQGEYGDEMPEIVDIDQGYVF